MYTIRKLARRQGLSRSIYSYSVGGVLAFVAALGCERTPAPKPSLRAPQPVSAAASDSAVPASAPVSSAPPPTRRLAERTFASANPRQGNLSRPGCSRCHALAIVAADRASFGHRGRPRSLRNH